MFLLRPCLQRKLAFCGVLALFVALLPFSDFLGSGNLPCPSAVRSGDVVFIRGKTLRSAVVRLVESRHSPYSHVGIVVVENGSTFIIHAAPASTTDKVAKEPWDVVISPKQANAAAIYRVADAFTSDRLGVQAATVAEQFWRDALPFDHEFDLTKPQRLYCTELVWRAYMAAGIDLRGKSFGSGRKYLLPSDLINSGLLREINASH